jgi:4-alpha-glucanotransferase
MPDNSIQDRWQKTGAKSRAGILAPLFSLHSRQSSGIGDFGDLKLLADWALATGNSIIQLLPMNEVGPLFCPYDSLSSFALEPMYIRLPEFDKLRKIFPASTPYVDYRIKQAKLRILQELYARKTGKDNSAVTKFKQENAYWLEDFALYKALKNYHQGRAWWQWQEKYRDRHPDDLADFRREHRQEIDFECWLQWLAFEQFQEAKDYAAGKKVLLNGDLPILVSRDSADVWQHPEFFKLEYAAGAPPDMYCALGQRWGMPTYNWQPIAADGYRYLKEKLRYAENFYDILRIDHVVGLFRIWSIPYNEPLDNQGLNGFFDPSDERLWEGQGRAILSVILASTRMLVCAEDLGVIPRACPKALEEFRIPGNDVQRWARDWEGTRDFLEPKDYRHYSVSMLSTHDTSNWTAWWQEEADKEEKEKLWQQMKLKGRMREKSDSEIVEAALKITLQARSVFSIQLIFDWLFLAGLLKGDPCQYRVNTPGTISEKNWSLRLPLALEDLAKHKLCRRMKEMIQASGRK